MKSAIHSAGLMVTVFLLCAASAQQEHTAWDDSLVHLLKECRADHLPTEQLENKMLEGRAKKRPPREIYSAVKVRRNLLLQVRAGNGGTLPGAYARELFSLEKSEQPSGSPDVRKVTAPPGRVTTRHAPETGTEVTPKHYAEDIVIDTMSAQKTVPPSNTPEHTDKHEQKTFEKMRKAEAHSEKMAEKAAERAEKRMNKIQKRLQKRAMKQNGGN